MALTRAELIERYLSDPEVNRAPFHAKMKFAAEFADMKTGDQDVILKTWVAGNVASAEVAKAEYQERVDEITATIQDVQDAGAALP